MPIPNGQITTTEIWNNPTPEPQLEDAPLPEEPAEDLTEEEKLDIALKIHKGEL